MSLILICPAEHADGVAQEYGPSHVVALCTPVDLNEAERTDALPSPSRGGPSEGVAFHRGGGRGAFPPLDVSTTPPTRPSAALGTTFPARGKENRNGRAFSDDPTATARLSLHFNDVTAPRAGLVAPSRADIAALLTFARTWDGKHPLLVHCRMGISRSTAAALIVGAITRPGTAEEALAGALRSVASCATPNPLMIAIADDLLGRNGRLVAAVQSIGRGADYTPYRVSVLDLDAVA